MDDLHKVYYDSISMLSLKKRYLIAHEILYTHFFLLTIQWACLAYGMCTYNMFLTSVLQTKVALNIN